MTGRGEDDRDSPETYPRGDETILLADDDAGIRQSVDRVLSRLGYTVLLAADGEEAVALYRRHREQVALVILDVVMPRMSGPDVYLALQREGIGTKALFTSSTDAAGELSLRTGDLAKVRYLPKPWTARELAGRVRAVLDGAD